MDDRNLNELLRTYAGAPIPALPGSFPQDVLREIRLRKDARKSDWLSEIYALLFRPGVLAASFSLAILVGVGLPAMMRPTNPGLTASSLGLGVFSSSMSELPSGTLASAQ
jgi:hypothetical protein